MNRILIMETDYPHYPQFPHFSYFYVPKIRSVEFKKSYVIIHFASAKKGTGYI